ncbi:VirB3 family type IV secretion system protein [Vibrio sp. 10N.261.46.A3]|uniref:VirB3 family type IV secretion system protein n=1 Tax=Vibrio sp. 10N.261.46.A3 TaxID=3229658 RepID=UPI0035529174
MSKVYRSITRPRLLLMLPADYLLFLSLSTCLVFQFGWLGAVILELFDRSTMWYVLVAFLGLGWVVGAIKAYYDPEFFAVHIAKFRVPTDKAKKKTDRYLNRIDIS